MGAQGLGGTNQSTQDERRGGRELRIALGMRGGVSLAVWMGGACAEIDTLRLAGDGGGEAAGFYGRMLDLAGFGGVNVDVMAGASAGGLNGALLASSLVYGVDFSTFRDVWLEVGDVNSLLRRRKDAPATSIMRGEFFLEQMRDCLRDKLRDRERREPADYVDLHLAVTATAARPVAVTGDSAAWYGEPTYRAGFRFRHNRYTSDFRLDPDEPIPDEVADAVAAKLAIAARASASFPGAFEPAKIEIARPKALGQRADPAATGDLVGLFSDASRDVAWVIDGGVLDNIPIERAIRSIAEAPADRATKRWLLYLCPSPDGLGMDGPPPGSSWDKDEAPDVLWTLKALLRAFGSRESLLEDMAALRAHNDLADRYAAARDLLVGRLSKASQTTPPAGSGGGRSAAGALLATAADSAEFYERDRAAWTAARVRALLEDPVETLEEDPFPKEPGWPLQDEESGPWSWSWRSELEKVLGKAFTGRLKGAATAKDAAAAAPLGPFPVARAARVLIGVIRAWESLLVDQQALERLEPLGREKKRLYGLLDVAGLLSHLDQLYWPVHLSAQPVADSSALGQWVEDAVAKHGTFLAGAHREDTLGPEGIAERFAWLREELVRRLRAADGEGSWERADDLVAWLWDQLGTRISALAAEVGKAPDLSGDPDVAAIVGVLGEIEAGHVEALACAVALEVVTAPLSRISPMPPQPIRFTRLAGTDQTPLKVHLRELASSGRIDVKDKLAGNDLGNFAAFYKRSWRANDWMWGRLDAVRTLLHIMLDPDELARRLRAGGDDGRGLLDALERVVTAPMPVGDGEIDQAAWTEHFSDLWAEARPGVEKEIVALTGPGGHTGLNATVEVLTARRHWELFADQLPDVLDIAAQEGGGRRLASGLRRLLGRQRKKRTGAATTPKDLQAAMEKYDIGKQNVAQDLGSYQLTRLAADGLISTWAALRWSLGDRTPHLLKPLGPGLRLLGWSTSTFPPLRRLVGLGKRRKGAGPG